MAKKKEKNYVTIECKKVYYINDYELVEAIDKLIADFYEENAIKSSADGEDRPPKPPNP